MPELGGASLSLLGELGLEKTDATTETLIIYNAPIFFGCKYNDMKP